MMEEDLTLARDLLRTMIDFLENSDVETIMEGEIHNYFRMSKQIEIYYGKFRQKGYYITMDLSDNSFALTSSDKNNLKYDLARIADHLYEKFCSPTASIPHLRKATDAFLSNFGEERFLKCVHKFAVLKRVFNIETIINRAKEHTFNFEACLLMDGFESILMNQDGMIRAEDLLGELIIDDECAETVVAMFGVENEIDVKACHNIKLLLLKKLSEKLKRQPHAFIWIKMLSATSLIDAVNSYEPFLMFILEIIKLLSEFIVYDPQSKNFTSPPDGLTYGNLVYTITKFYRNKNSCQTIINFIFNQCATHPDIWNSVLNACHNLPSIEATPEPFYDFSLPDMLSTAGFGMK